MSSELLNFFIRDLNYSFTNKKFYSNELYKTNFTNQVTKVDKDYLDYNDFFWDYMYQNMPIIITSISNTWPCRLQWINNDNGSSKVNFDFLKNKISNMLVPVANCSRQYFNSHEKCEMTFHEYLTYWENCQDANKNTQDINKNNILYLKDWHLKEKMPGYDFYKVPKYFASDWLNEFLIDKNEDDYRFVYMGPNGSWTPFHADVFSSFSWSTNIYGIKKWLLLPPCEELKLKDNLGNDPVNINEKLLVENGVKFFIIYQHENESIFVPSGWHHQVWNLTDTISVNHNWFNGCNIINIWKSLSNCMDKVHSEISDCEQMENFDIHSQLMLKALFGINFKDFLNIIEHITKKRVNCIKNNYELITFKTYKYNKDHILFDLNAIKKVIELLKENNVIKKNSEFFNQTKCLSDIIEDIFIKTNSSY